MKDAVALALKGNEGLSFKDPHTCCLCKLVAKNRKNLKRHLKCIHGRATTLYCDHCPKIYFARDRLTRHMKVHCQRVLACNHCDYKAAYKHNLTIHKLTHEVKKKCKICGKRVNSLKSHLKSHLPKEPCPVCGKKVRRYNMSSHVKIHRNKN